ncbi:ATPase [Bacillus wiedmannii]|uniref:ATPase n=1 Tax=Bacillus wiedmannii TaxID=1890302 RepID=UPI000B4335BB|nr:ATPase [Bacillus thuringiensis serovar argentinensis]
MPFTTGAIENQGNQPGNATNARVKILNRTGITITGLVRSFRLNGTRVLIQQSSFTVATNASGFVTLNLVHPNLGQAAQYEVEIVPNQSGGVYSVYGRTGAGTIINTQRVLHSELTQIP